MDDPKQILRDSPSKTGFLTGSLEIFDINILPERYRPKKVRLIAVLPWLFLIFFLAALYPSVLIAREAQSIYKQSQIEVAIMETSFENFQSAADEMVALQEEIDLESDRKNQIVDSYQGIDFQGSNWSPTLFRINQNAPDGISWISIIQQDQEISLNGTASSYDVILDLQDSLRSLEEFSKVKVEYIDQVIIDPAEIIVVDSGEESLPLYTAPPTYTFSLVAYLDQEGQ
jgi:Tfp pilus assembly protein PilN